MGIQHKVLFLYLFFIGVEGTEDRDLGWFGNYCQHKYKCINKRCLEDDQCNLGGSVRTNELLVTSFPSLSPELVLDDNDDTYSINNFRFYFWNGIHMIENIFMWEDNTLDIRNRWRASVNQLIIYTNEPKEFCSIHFYDETICYENDEKTDERPNIVCCACIFDCDTRYNRSLGCSLSKHKDLQRNQEFVNEKQNNPLESTSFLSFVLIGGLSAIILILLLVVCLICILYRQLLRVSLTERKVVKRKQRVQSPSCSEEEQRRIKRDSSIYLNVKKHFQLNNTNMALGGGGDTEDVQLKLDTFTTAGSDQSNFRSSARTANVEEDLYEKLSMKNHQSETKY
ncbi:hypothetical protein Bpfe_023091 [Biomphalaria pfeifferi]|uniref:Uncharacterized protein n=1 Tax=Biomphalaria pfeifferi TaxID=112525 RepID=A0AAD8F2D8_BIOPF|nr:hypothetical protein Bpfe_023091 [Biomphalaria pfeifferi]